MPYAATCHLSGLLINEGEDIIALPVCYSEVLHTNTMVYTSSSSIYPLWLPVEGKYSGYGSITSVDNELESNKMFLNLLNKSFISKSKSQNSFALNSFCVFKDEDYNQAKHGEFVSQLEAQKKFKEKDFFDIGDFDSLEYFFDLISNRAVFNFTGSIFERVGVIFIKKDVLNGFCERKLLEKISTIKEKSISFLNEKKLANIEFREFRKNNLDDKNPDIKKISDDLFYKTDISCDYVKSHLLAIFNGANNLPYSLIFELNYCFKKSIDFDIKNLVNSIALFASVELTYQLVGKSYYPNVRREGCISGIIALSESILEITDKIQDKNKVKFKEYGYDINDPKDAETFEKEFRYQDWN